MIMMILPWPWQNLFLEIVLRISPDPGIQSSGTPLLWGCLGAEVSLTAGHYEAMVHQTPSCSYALKLSPFCRLWEQTYGGKQWWSACALQAWLWARKNMSISKSRILYCIMSFERYWDESLMDHFTSLVSVLVWHFIFFLEGAYLYFHSLKSLKMWGNW